MRLFRAREEEKAARRAVLDIEWRPLEIHPEVPRGGLPLESLPYSAAEISSMLAHLRKEGESEGLDFGGISRGGRLINTHRALLAGCYAREEEGEHFEDFHLALFRGHFSEGKDLDSPSVLRGIAAASGLDAGRMEEACEAGTHEHLLEEASAAAGRAGVTGVPTFVFHGRVVIVGAQPVSSLRKAAARIIGRTDGAGRA